METVADTPMGLNPLPSHEGRHDAASFLHILKRLNPLPSHEGRRSMESHLQMMI